MVFIDEEMSFFFIIIMWDCQEIFLTEQLKNNAKNIFKESLCL